MAVVSPFPFDPSPPSPSSGLKLSWKGWLGLVLLLGWWGWSAPALAAAVPWKTIGVDPSTLSSKQKKVIANVLQSEFCYHACSDTILNCLKKHPDYRIVKRLARLVVRLARRGMVCSAISKELRLRARSAHPFRVHKIEPGNHKPRGKASAPVTVVMFADFQCPFCRKVAPMLRELEKKMRGKIKVYFFQFPVKGHKEGVISARACLAALKQGKFWAMHDRLYRQPRDKLQKPHLLQCAKEVGLNMKQFKRDLKAPWTLKQVRQEKMMGLRLGVRGTPALFINGKMYYGEKRKSEIRDRLEEEYDLAMNRK